MSHNQNEVEVNPREIVQEFRRNYVNAHEAKKRIPGAHQGVDVQTRGQKPLRENDLGPGIRRLLQDYRQAHPGTKIELLKHQRLENGTPTSIVEDETGLPDEDALLTLSETHTLATSSEVRVLTEIVVASVTRG
jgi:hypothetical protein